MRTRNYSAVPPGPPPVLYSVERSKALKLVELTELFLPHVTSILRPKAKKGVAALMRLVLADRAEIKPLIASLRDGSAPPERVTAFRACGIGFKPTTMAGLRQNVTQVTRDNIENATMKMVKAWLDTFPPPRGIPTLINADELDGAMLLLMGRAESRRFSADCQRACLTVEEAMEILCNVRSRLPEETAFPDAAADFLNASVITACS